jgi:hypothetical protein
MSTAGFACQEVPGGDDSRSHLIPSRRYAAGLWLLLVLFAFRVVAQPMALVVHSTLLPPFESWHSAALPYGVLFASQVAILLVLAWTAWRFTNGGVEARRGVGIVALALGGLYFAIMLARLILGLTALNHLRWFASPIPTVFHLVLATSLLLYGRFHYIYGAKISPDQ